jgi:flavin reductase (DIM6/NTAB) family NADH-FMN oxidoreductase RutF
MNAVNCNSTDFKTACSRFPTGVTITTFLDNQGTPCGITVSSFTSVSLSPPLILVCIDFRSPVLQHVAVGRYFGVNVLSECQQELSVKFSRDCSNRFSNIEWYAGQTGVPLFFNVPATFECQVTELLPAGDHLIVIGKVEYVRCGEGCALAYVNRGYGKVFASAAVEI